MELKGKQALCVALLLHGDEEEIAKKRPKPSVLVTPWLQRNLW